MSLFPKPPAILLNGIPMCIPSCVPVPASEMCLQLVIATCYMGRFSSGAVVFSPCMHMSFRITCPLHMPFFLLLPVSLAEQGITYTPTFVVYKKGRKVSRGAHQSRWRLRCMYFMSSNFAYPKTLLHNHCCWALDGSCSAEATLESEDGMVGSNGA